MDSIRTDLAVERTAAAPELPGVTQETRGKAFSVTEICIKNDTCGAPIGKPAGRYVTLEAEALSRNSAQYEEMAEELAAELERFLPKEGCVFVAGLGNRAITPDALGPRVASKVLATRHLRTALSKEELEYLPELRPVCVLAGGVLGQTGMESAELLEAVCHQVQPAAVVAVDALACAELSRLGTTIQMSDSGISPGSGVANHRAELSKRTLGVPVVALGVPTVVDLHTAVQGIYGKSVPKNRPNMMVTPRDVDRLIDHAGDLLACSLNMALHPGMTFAQAEGLG
ncbi:GPR endopeptidase [uncultured Ruminococcus sp.]|uniref:GPR endopeptidase n=1 Tax=uncultured Ruminococcus sp. TaxID=165186 RepID=UPI00262BFC73|nr:GPR endopeptidase [uncultured Ruminococcus sp.]